MKKLIFSGFMSITLLLSACGTTDDTEQSTDEDTTQSDTNEESTGTNDEGIESEQSVYGNLTVIKSNKELAMTETTGSMNLTLHAIQLATLEVDENYKDAFDNQDTVSIVKINMTVENTSDKTISWYPNQSTIVTDTGQQVDADLWFSDDVGGDFLGKVKKEGNTIWVLKYDEAIKNVTLHINAPHDEEFNSIGEDLQLKIPVQ